MESSELQSKASKLVAYLQGLRRRIVLHFTPLRMLAASILGALFIFTFGVAYAAYTTTDQICTTSGCGSVTNTLSGYLSQDGTYGYYSPGSTVTVNTSANGSGVPYYYYDELTPSWTGTTVYPFNATYDSGGVITNAANFTAPSTYGHYTINSYEVQQDYYNGDQTAASNSLSVDVTTPSPTLSSTVTCNASGNTATLTWSAVSGPAGMTYPVRVDDTDAGATCSTSDRVYLDPQNGANKCGDGTTEFILDTYTGTSITVNVTPGTNYRAWVHTLTSAYGWSQVSNAVTFKCTAPPTIGSVTATNIGVAAATQGATVSSDGGATVTTRGMCQSTSPTPRIDCAASGSGTGTYTVTRTNMTNAPRTWYIAGYATNANGTTWTPDTAITLQSAPTVTTPTATSIGTTQAITGANFATNASSVTITARGTCTGTSPQPTSCTSSGSTALGTYTQSTTGLTQGTTYYTRGYLSFTDGAGIASTTYSSDLSFTSQSVPTLTLPTSSSIGQTTATLGATLTNSSSLTVTARGTCWATTVNPTTNCLSDGGTTSGAYTQSRSGFTCNTLYHYRGYMTYTDGAGVSGTVYSSDATFTTSACTTAPTLSSPTFSSVGTTQAVLGATVTSNGGAALTARGTCWSTVSGQATLALGTCVAEGGTTVSAYTQTMSGLPSGTTVYFAGYATNSVGTSYSAQSSFTTATPLSLSGQTVTFVAAGNNFATLSTTGGSGTGAVTYAVTAAGAGCSISGSTLTYTTAGTCGVTATKAADATYTSNVSSQATFTINKANPTLSVTNSPVTYTGSAQSPTVSGSVAGSVSNILVGGAASQTNAGTYAVTANFTPTDTTDYNTLTGASAGNFVINKASQSALTFSGQTVTFVAAGNNFATLSTTGGSGTGAVTYAVTAAGAGCSISGSTLTYTTAGTCGVTATKAADTNYNLVSSAQATFTINKATPTLSVTNSPVTYTGSGQTATVSGSVPGTASSILVGGAASQTTVGTYAVTANFTPTDTTDYNTLTGASAGNFVINQATPTLSVTNSPVTYTGSGQIAAVSGSVAGSVSNILVGGAPTQTTAGTYAVTANFTPTDTTDYTSLTAASAGNFVINKATPTLSVTNSPVTYTGSPQTPTVVGSVAGSVSNILVGGAASQTNVGSYAVTANFTPTDTTDYNTLTGASAGNFVINQATQAALTITSTSGTYPGPLSMTTSGGSGTGAVTYVVNSAGTAGCSIVGSTLSFTAAGTCTVTATKAADSNYLAASSISTTITIAKGTQAALTITSTSGTYPTSVSLTTSGGSGTGAVTYVVDVAGTAGCSVSGSTLNYTSAGTCNVTATKAADSGYNAISSVSTTITINKANQSALTITSTSGTYPGPLTMSTSGGTGTGGVSYVVNSAGTAGCSVSGNSLSFTAAGTCTVTATKAADTNYNAISSISTTITIAKGNQAALSITTTSTSYPGPLTLITSGGSGTGAVTYVVDVAGAAGCSVTGATLSFTAAGTCNVTATKASDSGYNATSSLSTTITIAANAPTISFPVSSSIGTSTVTLGGTVTSGGGAALSARGTCWSTTPTPRTNCVAEGGTSVAAFTQARTGLTQGTIYYFAAYATNSVGTTYTSDGTFTTKAPPTVVSPTVTSISTSSAVLGANISSNGGDVITDRGVCWDTTPSPTAHCTSEGATTTGVFTVNISGFSSNTLIYYRGYATNPWGTSYSTDGTFNTYGIPSISGQSVSNVSSTGATISATIGSNNGSALTVRGTCYDVAPSPTNNCTPEGGTSTGVFSHTRTGLTPGTTYYYRAYATNGFGTAYTPDGSFTTPLITDPSSVVAQAGNGNITLSYVDPTDSDLKAIVVLMSTSSPVSATPSSGTFYSQGATIGGSTVACVDSLVGPSLADSCTLNNLTNGTAYYFKVYAVDSFNRYSAGVVPSGSPATPTYSTVLGNGSDPVTTTIAPGDPATFVDSFTFKTATSSEVISSLVINLANASSTSLVEVTNDTGTVVYGSSTNPTGASTTITLNMNTLTATTVQTQYKIRITPKTQANLPVGALGQLYSVTATVASWTGTYFRSGGDTSSAVVTIDNAPPSDLTSPTIITGDSKFSLSYIAPPESDYSSVVVLTSTSPISAVPTDGSIYTVGNLIGSAQVSCIDNGGHAGFLSSCSVSGLSNGTLYYVKIFTLDTRGNYSAGISYTVTPAIPPSTEKVTSFRFRNDDGNEANATYRLPENTSITASNSLIKGDKVRLRFAVSNESGSTIARTYQLEYSSGACTVWSPIPRASDITNQPFKMDTSTYVADGTFTTHTASVSTPTGKTFIPGVVQTYSELAPQITLLTGQYTEVEFSFRSTVYSVDGTTYCFRLSNAGEAGDFISQTMPTILLLSNQYRYQSGGGGGGRAINQIETSANASTTKTGGSASSTSTSTETSASSTPTSTTTPPKGSAGDSDVGMLFPSSRFALGSSTGLVLGANAYKMCTDFKKNYAYGMQDGVAESKISELQYYLKGLGYYSYRITGFFGRFTQDAVKRFQKDNYLPQTGTLNEATRLKMSEQGCTKDSQ